MTRQNQTYISQSSPTNQTNSQGDNLRRQKNQIVLLEGCQICHSGSTRPVATLPI